MSLRWHAALPFAIAALAGSNLCAAELTAAKVDETVTTWMTTHQVPGASIAIWRDGEPWHARSFGLANRETGDAVTAETVFQIGSISKQFTAAATLQLVQEGKLSLDQPLAEALPGFRGPTDGITVRHMLTHTSGLPELIFQKEYLALESVPPEEATRDRLVALLQAATPVFAPGERWSYSNANWTLLSLIIEQAARQPYHDRIARMLAPVVPGHRIAAYDPLPAGAYPAIGYARRGPEIVRAPGVPAGLAIGDGSLAATATDLARWLQALVNGEVVSAPLFDSMTTPTPVQRHPAAPYGFGLSLAPFEGAARIGHGGRMPGFSSSVAHYPHLDLTIALLSNAGGVDPEVVEKKLLRHLLDRAPPTARPADPAASATLTGAWDLGVFAISVVPHDDGLRLVMPEPAPSVQLQAFGARTWMARDEPDSLVVELLAPASGSTPQIRVEFAGMHWFGFRQR